MKPVLYSSTETEFTSNGLGVLNDTVSAVVLEERNGAYELTMEYPADGIHFSDISARCIILAKPNPTDSPQPFRIYRITKPIGGIVTIYAQHISYDLSGVAVSPFSANTLAEAISAMQSHALPSDQPFTLTTDMDKGTGLSITTPASFRAMMGGQENSLVDIYGGEYSYDKYSISLNANRGEDRGFTLRYGKNLTSFEQDENCAAVYSHIYPYWTDGTTTIEVNNGEYGKLVPTTGTELPYTKILPKDLSSYFENQPTAADLLTTAKLYASKAQLGVPKVSLTVSFAQLEENGIDRVNLCDTVTVVFPKMGVNAKAKVVTAEYDVLLERYTTLEIGSSTQGIADTIASQQYQIESIPSSVGMQEAILKATAWITGTVDAGKVVFVRNQNGDPTAIKIVSTTKPEGAEYYPMWIISAGGIGYSTDGGATISNIGLTADGHIVADTINLNTANISGHLSASNIDATNLHVQSANIDGVLTADQIDGNNLHVKAANIDGDITADAINLNTAHIDGTLSAQNIDVDSITVKNANIESLYASKIIGGSGTQGGYIASKAISDNSHWLDSMYTTSGSFVNLATSYLTVNNNIKLYSGESAVVTMGATGVIFGGVTYAWRDILSGSGSGGAVFG